jgi:hypothetical protein
LKEFGDFETYNTPKYRHPPIKGLPEELSQIGLLQELVGLKIYADQDLVEKYKEYLGQEQKDQKTKIQESINELK